MRDVGRRLRGAGVRGEGGGGGGGRRRGGASGVKGGRRWELCGNRTPGLGGGVFFFFLIYLLFCFISFRSLYSLFVSCITSFLVSPFSVFFFFFPSLSIFLLLSPYRSPLT